MDSNRIVRSDAADLPLSTIGGKAANLVRLQRAGLPVPPWFCVTTAVFRDVSAAALAPLAGDLVQFDASNQDQATRISARIGEGIHSKGLSDRDRDALHEGYRALIGQSRFVAVRSSAADEDSAGTSFAGQMDSFLFVPEQDLERRVLDCFASCFSPRALAYRKHHQKPLAQDAAVIVQRMVDSRISGVLFTANPTSRDLNEIVVCAAMGVGEGVVADRAEADTFYVDAATLTVRHRVEVPKRARVGFDAAHGAGTAVIEVGEDDAVRSTLSDAQLADLARLGKDVQRLFGCPQDVEWALDDADSLYLLQARPITTLEPARTTIFDNANIVESYPGWSLPLTYSFVRAAYEYTFRATSRTMGVPESVLKANQSVHANLVALINGSIYYNLLNWYKLFLFVPGFDGALPAWEQALGVQGITPPREPPPGTVLGRLRARWRQLRVAGRLAWLFVSLDTKVATFHRLFRGIQEDFKQQSLERADAHDLVELSERVVAGFAEPYAISVVNDAFVQQLYAQVGKLIARWELGEPGLRNDLLAGEGVMQSILPVQSLIALAGEIHGDAALRELFGATPADEIWERLGRVQRFASFRGRLVRHIEEFGDRTFQELKLETPSASDDPALVVELLRSYAGRGLSGPSRTDDRRRAAEAIVAAKLSGRPIRRAIFSFVLGRCRRMVAHREDMRLSRSRGFGLMKRIVRALGDRMTRAGLLNDPRDIFYLGIDEVTAAVRGSSITRDLRALVDQRRAEYEVFKQRPLPSRVTTHGIALSSVTSGVAQVASRPVGLGELQGIGCSAGRVRARARVVREPQQHLHIHGEILVAPMTDPGWVFLMVPAGGLIVERGSVLSHTAIIGRELGIPTVVAVQDATSRIREGQLVEMDGATGVVRLLD
ncbi:MAG: PEP/pyruvate-binding domain-containing protein [Vicinamibacterales bacterium]